MNAQQLAQIMDRVNDRCFPAIRTNNWGAETVLSISARNGANSIIYQVQFGLGEGGVMPIPHAGVR